MEKHRRLEQIIRSQEPGSKIIIFCSTKKMCDQLARNLTRQFGAAAIHGDKCQSERDFVLNQFRNGRSPVLVATDVAARGLDIKDIRLKIVVIFNSFKYHQIFIFKHITISLVAFVAFLIDYNFYYILSDSQMEEEKRNLCVIAVCVM